MPFLNIFPASDYGRGSESSGRVLARLSARRVPGFSGDWGNASILWGWGAAEPLGHPPSLGSVRLCWDERDEFFLNGSLKTPLPALCAVR